MTSAWTDERSSRSQGVPTSRPASRRRRARRTRIAGKPVPREFSGIGAAIGIGAAGIPGLTFDEPSSPSVPTYAEWFCEQIVPSRRMTLFSAFYLHWIVLLCLAAIYLHGPEQIPPLCLDAIFIENEPMDDVLMEVVSTEFDDSDLNSEAVDADRAPDLSVLSASTIMPTFNQPVLDAIPDFLADLSKSLPAAAKQNAAAVEDQKSLPIHVPQHAVTAGSFSVWTEPKNPAPQEPYKIVIQIRLPDNTETYSVADLEGMIVGSDGYQKLIPGPIHGFLPVDNGQVRLEVHVVSADELVEDTVFIRSKLLREAQRLQVRF